ncbi:hypothetical protein CSE16_09810 [Solibacillus sp. R5-41]|uniref:DUF3307 domain-containing protein n=1 Tax=Solibacillus sp. R5-41 TaxID=2048654 RepID=UPI000C1248EF|nr:DUF3307 domain-containing protein [Solibacillus sp. R5-41]ATP40317.1 hypothetical protein CSE16_09810 [Solibacillus sp. R5-41]
MLILLFILGHLIADYPLQSDRLVKKKQSGTMGVFQHVGIHLITYVVLVIVSIFLGLIEFNVIIIFYLFIICLLHLLTDLIKEKLNNRIVKCSNLSPHQISMRLTLLYISDQLIHIFSIVAFAILLFEDYNSLPNKLIDFVTARETIELNFQTKIIGTLIILLTNTYFFGHLIGKMLSEFRPTNKIIETSIEGSFTSSNTNLRYEGFSELNIETQLDKYVTKAEDDVKLNKKISFISDSPPKAGMWIGVLERNLILILCVSNNLSSIGFLIAMKALTRFKQFDDKSFSEYYLIGTMLSVILGITAGFVMNFIWG